METTQVCAVARSVAPGSLAILGINDGYVPGIIGKRNLLKGCYSFFEAWSLAARQIVLDGRRQEALAALDAGATVRTLLRDWYGVFSETVSLETAASEVRAFRRTMRRVA